MKIIPIKNGHCTCNAYDYPHEAAAGECNDPGDDPHGCEDCEHAEKEYDPYGTGDRYLCITECTFGDDCPWGHDD